MATKKNINQEEAKSKEYKEGALILLFKLKRITTYYTPLMKEWLDVEIPTLDMVEQTIFDRKLFEAQE
jgi:hypothetical protein